MKHWLKENWFKLGILIAIFVALIMFFGQNGANQNLQSTSTGNVNTQSSSGTTSATVDNGSTNASSSAFQTIQATEWFTTGDSDVRDTPFYTGNILGVFRKGISFYATAEDPSGNWLGFGWTDTNGNNQGAWISKNTLSSTTVNLTAAESTVVKTLYTHSVVNLREYPWATSRVVRTVPASSNFQIWQIDGLSSSSWGYIASFDGVPYNAWLSKSVLYGTQLKQPAQQQTATSPTLTIQAQSVVKLICKQRAYSNSYKQGSGSLGYIVTNGYGFKPFSIETNLHVVNTDDGSPSQCLIAIYPNIGDSSNYLLYQSSGYNYINSNIDLAFVQPELIPNNPNAGTINDLYTYAQSELKELVCDNVTLGEHLWIVGYPAIGGETLTETQGIVAGFETDGGVPYIKTDAKIDHGNSGGIAVADSGCFLGVPTFVEAGQLESLGRIINVPALFKSLNTTNGVQPLHSN